MNFRDELIAAAEAVASNPKVTVGVSMATSSLGVASATELISGALSGAAILSGIVATVLLGRVHWTNQKNLAIQNQILRRQLQEMGGDPDLDE